MTQKKFAGTWKLNLKKSSIPPLTKSQILTIETDGVNVTMREELINDKDELLLITADGKFDGRDYPVTGTQFADTVSYRLLDPRTIEGIAKKDGQICVKETVVLSDEETQSMSPMRAMTIRAMYTLHMECLSELHNI